MTDIIPVNSIERQVMIVKAEEHKLGGAQLVLRFGNGYGASIVRGPFSYGGTEGLFEIAVLCFFDEGPEYHLTYDTPITDDVVGFLELNDAINILQQIADLKPGGHKCDF